MLGSDKELPSSLSRKLTTQDASWVQSPLGYPKNLFELMNKVKHKQHDTSVYLKSTKIYEISHFIKFEVNVLNV